MYQCVENNVVCYYERSQSINCAECLRHQMARDGAFPLEEWQKAGEQKRESLSCWPRGARGAPLVSRAEKNDGGGAGPLHGRTG